MSDHPRLDGRTLLVLSSHPLRSRLLGQLRLDGPATATELARALDTNTGATSYHLRRLEEVGLVEDTGTGAGRQRVWRAAHEMHSWRASDLAGDDEGEAALSLLYAGHLRHFTEKAQRWISREQAWPSRWRDLAGSGDYLVHVSPDQLEAMQQELYAVLERYRANEPEPGAAPVWTVVHFLPEGDPGSGADQA